MYHTYKIYVVNKQKFFTVIFEIWNLLKSFLEEKVPDQLLKNSENIHRTG